MTNIYNVKIFTFNGSSEKLLLVIRDLSGVSVVEDSIGVVRLGLVPHTERVVDIRVDELYVAN